MAEVGDQKHKQEHAPHLRVVGCAQDKRLTQREGQIHVSQAPHRDQRGRRHGQDASEPARLRKLQVCLGQEEGIVCSDKARDGLDVEKEDLIRQRRDLGCHGC